MNSHTYVQRHSTVESESAHPQMQSRPFSDPLHEQPQAPRHDFSQVDLFSHAPQRGVVQTKLTVGAPNDVYEQEADRVADQVLSMPDTAAQQPIQREGMEDEELQAKPLNSMIQREGMEDEELQAKPLDSMIQREGMEEEELQAKPLDSMIQREGMEEEELQMKPQSSPMAAATPALEAQLGNSQGNGSPLPTEVRSFMEPRFGADFSQVRVHTNSDAIQMNQDLSAQAFTHKQDIYFGAGKAPGNDALTAHELTHVIQQTGAIAPKAIDSEPTQQ
jgi:hypothetical protein